jgi:hypothetical protein
MNDQILTVSANSMKSSFTASRVGFLISAIAFAVVAAYLSGFIEVKPSTRAAALDFLVTIGSLELNSSQPDVK